MKSLVKDRFKLCFYFIIGFYLISHLLFLTKLPVFADEAIYIRWAQLIIDDWQRYAFFPMNDGKPPLFLWLLVPGQFIFQNQLLAGRVLSVLIGFFQLIVLQKLTRRLGGDKIAQIFSMLLGCCLPFWFFHHRMALMDGALTLFSSLTWLFALKARGELKRKNKIESKLLLNLLLTGLFLGLSFLIKLPAVLLIPLIPISLILFLAKEKLFKACALSGVPVLTGLFIFSLLRLHPAFPQLFSRGGDFLFTLEEIFTQQEWRTVLKQMPKYGTTLSTYLTWPVILLSFYAFFTKHRRAAWISHLSWMAFAYPIFLMGKVVYPRYLLPVTPFITVAASLGFSHLFSQLQSKLQSTSKKILQVLIFLIIIIISGRSLLFMFTQYTDPSQSNFVPIDQEQYLYEWSAGYGISETVSLLNQLAKTKKVLVLTEGYFGTLPDGLLMYLHRRPVDNLFITGIGQPINQLKSSKNTSNFDQVLLVANSHRINNPLNNSRLILEICRPHKAPCHQVWDITAEF